MPIMTRQPPPSVTWMPPMTRRRGRGCGFGSRPGMGCMSAVLPSRHPSHPPAATAAAEYHRDAGRHDEQRPGLRQEHPAIHVREHQYTDQRQKKAVAVAPPGNLLIVQHGAVGRRGRFDLTVLMAEHHAQPRDDKEHRPEMVEGQMPTPLIAHAIDQEKPAKHDEEYAGQGLRRTPAA